MLDFRIVYDVQRKRRILKTSLSGKPLLTTPQLNKGTAFTAEERLTFGLLGKLPATIETLDEQVQRAYAQFLACEGPMRKNIYLTGLHESNQVLFYRLVSDHLEEMMPIIYTPIVGNAVKNFSAEFRRPRGIYVAYPERDYMDAILGNRSHPEIDLIVVTDGEGVLGIGDQGVGGMDIPIAKLMVYTLCGGISPLRTLPILLDVGTNNEELLNDPLYLGWRHPRLSGQAYDDFIHSFVQAVKKHFPNVFLHWEDFGRDNARRNLERYQQEICTFNDDMQGTGVVALSALLAATRMNQQNLEEHRIVVFGAGTAGTGISDQILAALMHYGIPREQALRQFWLIDREGLLQTHQTLTPAQIPYARDPAELATWDVADKAKISLAETVHAVQPTILIGCSACKGAFTEAIVRDLASKVQHPIIFPLSNPTEKCEAHPQDLLAWTDGRALIATGTPFGEVAYASRQHRIAQCNNALVFPGLGLGIVTVQAQRLTDSMLWAACQTLSENAPILKDPTAPLLPIIADARQVAEKIAFSVAKQAVQDRVCPAYTDDEIEQRLAHTLWRPEYLEYERI